MWRKVSSNYTADAKGSILETMALCRLLASGYMQLTLEPTHLRLTARTIASF